MRALVVVAAAALALTALGCSEESRPRAAASVVGPTANTGCMQARIGAGAPARRLAARARRALPIATRTLAALQDVPAVELRREYERLFGLYRQAATPGRRGAGRLAQAVAAAEESVRAQARAAGLPACSPP